MLTILLNIQCKNTNAQHRSAPTKKATITYINQDIEEPSGIVYTPDNTLWVVDDEGILFQLDRNGQILQRYGFENATHDMEYDFEGLTYNSYDNTLIVAIEGDELLGIFDQNVGDFTGFIHLYEVLNDIDGENNGTEGVTMVNDRIFIVRQNTGNAGLFCLTMNNSSITNDCAETLPFNDASGICPVPGSNELYYIIADTEEIIYTYDFASGNIVDQIELPVGDDIDYEGITVANDARHVEWA